MSNISENGVPQVTPEEAAARVDEGALLLDVREDDEWTAGHAPEAQHLALGRLQDEHGTLPKDRPIIAVCRVGGRSERAAVALRGAGYDVVNLAGGMRAWAAAGQSVVTDDGEVGTVI
jgi:rhodanese-related sulfurtransferase